MEILRSVSSNGATEIADIWNGWFSSVGTWAAAAATSAAAFYTAKAAQASSDAAKAAEKAANQWRDIKQFDAITDANINLTIQNSTVIHILGQDYRQLFDEERIIHEVLLNTQLILEDINQLAPETERKLLTLEAMVDTSNRFTLDEKKKCRGHLMKYMNELRGFRRDIGAISKVSTNRNSSNKTINNYLLTNTTRGEGYQTLVKSITNVQIILMYLKQHDMKESYSDFEKENVSKIMQQFEKLINDDEKY